jgi:phytoene dehydrogenase-like protein
MSGGAERYDALIVGAGFSGLAAGIRLAQFGQRVAILERHYLWGGLNSFYKRGGRLFDTGLHALTNFSSDRASPLRRVLRALRIPFEALELGEQSTSEIVFPGVRLLFSNDFELMRSQVAERFPRASDGFDRLVRALPSYDDFGGPAATESARRQLAEHVSDPLLREMLFCPVAFYGSAREDDVDWDQFAVLFRSMFLEGLARPAGGIRPFLKLCVERFRDLGGELRLSCGVQRILVHAGSVQGVALDDGSELVSDVVLSSAGHVETLRLAGREPAPAARGRISVLETLACLDAKPAELGYPLTATFFCDAERFDYRCPDDDVDVRSGVVCTPDNYASADPAAEHERRAAALTCDAAERSEARGAEGVLRVSVLANHARFAHLDEQAYQARKLAASERALASAARFVPDVRPHVVFQDVFTPRTIARFTGHDNGAIYGSPHKRRDGDIGISGLSVIGNDQGMVGIVGAMLSGVLTANRCAAAARAGAP